ncbi:MAG: hypothetical protein GXY81_04195 [Candidatus Cloacimonetes bacterium]|nr:hypothetical protein [Candidatus Cloacimonadota bacterium]
MKQNKDLQGRLRAPFPREDIEFRVSRVSSKNSRAAVLAYITARGIMERLDEVFGMGNWQDEYELLPTGVKCRLSVNMDGNWVTKEDAAPFTNIEALKGAFSDALKRAGVKFGIGRYIYELPEYWVEIQAERPRNAVLPVHHHNSDTLSGWWEEPQLPDWALPEAVLDRQGAELLNELLQSKWLTRNKYEQYRHILANPRASETSRALALKQLSLIRLWGHRVFGDESVELEVKKDIYRSILNSGADDIEKIEVELLKLAEDKGEAA